VPLGPDLDFFENMKDAYEGTWPRHVSSSRVPTQPDDDVCRPFFFEQLVAFARSTRCS